MKRKFNTELLFAVTFFGVAIAYLIYSEVSHARQVRPTGISTIADFFDRFGEPTFAGDVDFNCQLYIELAGPWPPPWSLAVPSSRPAYVFDLNGNFVDWCSDPGDNPTWRARWPIANARQIHIDEIRRRYAH